MAGHWQNLLEALLGDPQRRIAELPLFAAEERKQLLLAGTAGEAGLQDILHGLFAARVAASPQAPALTFAGQTLSYAELDARSNRLARVLRSHGVGPEVRVGLALERLAGDGRRPAGDPQAPAAPTCRWTRNIRWSACNT